MKQAVVKSVSGDTLTRYAIPLKQGLDSPRRGRAVSIARVGDEFVVMVRPGTSPGDLAGLARCFTAWMREYEESLLEETPA